MVARAPVAQQRIAARRLRRRVGGDGSDSSCWRPTDATQGDRSRRFSTFTCPALSPPTRASSVTGVCERTLPLDSTTRSYDRVALASAEVGVLFCTLVIVTGPIWAKGTWGHWWSWDPRLTVTLLQWFVYLSYLLLRSFTEGSTRTARFAAVYGVVMACCSACR